MQKTDPNQTTDCPYCDTSGRCTYVCEQDGQLSSDLPTHEAAARIAEAARKLGFAVQRSAASPFNRSSYVFCNGIKVRVADHANDAMPDIDVHVGNPRAGAVDWKTAVAYLKGRLCSD